MIRDLLVAAVFFFGPMLVMFVLRNLASLFSLWLVVRRQRRLQPKVIDVSPTVDRSPSLAFVALAILIGALSAYTAWHHTRQETMGHNLELQYVPAHLDDHGRMIPGKLVPRPGTPDSDSAQ